MEIFSNLKVKVTAAILVLLLYSFVAVSIYFVTKQAGLGLSVEVSGVPAGVVTVDSVSLFGGRRYAATEKDPGVFSRGAEYISGFELTLPKQDVGKIEAIDVCIGQTRYSLGQENLQEGFSIARRDGKAVLSSKSRFFGTSSCVPVLNRCITWKGDLNMICLAVRQYAAILGVILFSLFVAQKLPRKEGWLYRGVCQHAKLFISLVLAFAGALSFFYIGRVYHANDDLAILDAIKCGAPVSFMSLSLGRVMACLYSTLPLNIEWYGWLLYLENITALLVILRATEKLVKNRLVFVVSATVLIGMFLFGFSEMTFTMSALLLSGAALYAFLVYLSLGTITPRTSLGLGALLALGILIRPQTFTALIVYFGLWSAYVVFRCRKQFVVRRLLLILFLFGAPLVTAFLAETVVLPAGLPDESHRFIEYNRARGRLHDFPVLHQNHDNPKLLQQNKWSSNDYSMFANWMFFDETKFTLESLRNILKIPPEDPPLVRAGDFVKAGRAVITQNGLFFLLILSLLLLPDPQCTGIAERKIILLLFSGYLLAGSTLMIMFLRFPVRISYPLFLISVLFGWLFALMPHKARPVEVRSGLYQTAFVFIGLMAVQFNVSAAIELKQSYDGRKQRFDLITENVEKKCPASVILFHPAQWHVHHVDPLHCFKPFRTGVRWLPAGGWTTFSPQFYRHIKEVGLKQGRDLFSKLYTDKTYYFLGDKGTAELVETYLKENFDDNAYLSSRQEVDGALQLFQFSIRENGSLHGEEKPAVPIAL